MRSAVQLPTHFSSFQVAEFAHRCWVRLQTIGGDRFDLPVPLQRMLEESQIDLFVALPCDVTLGQFAIVINCAPQILWLSDDLREDHIDVRASAVNSTYSFDPLSLYVGREHWGKPVSPETNRLVAIVDAAFGQKIFDIPQAQRKTNKQHHREPNDFRR